MEGKDKYSFLDHPKRILVGGVAIGVGGFLLYKLARKVITGIQQRNTESLADDSPEVRQAMALRSGMNPSGISWMKSFDTTNTSIVFDTARQIRKLDEVGNAYRKLYDDDLLRDLQNELSASDYQKFLTMVSSNPAKANGSAPVKFAAKSQMVVAKKEVFLRSSPDASYHAALYQAFKGDKNIIRKARAGEFLGYATGNQSFDVKNNVKFIEVAYLVKKENPPAAVKASAGKSFRFWVSSSASYVDIFAFYKDMWAKYPSTQNETSYKKPLDYYGGVAGFLAKPVVTIRTARVMNEQFKHPLSVQAQTLLGEFIMTLDTGKGSFVKFRTVDNTLRWVAASDVRIQ
jgi:hypothetical protein